MGPPGGNKPSAPPGDSNNRVNYVHNDERPSEEDLQQSQQRSFPQPQTVNPQSVRRRPAPVPLDSTDGPQMGVNVNVRYQQQPHRSTPSHTTTDEVEDSTPSIFTSFIVNRMENDGYDVPAEILNRRLGNNEKQIAQVLQRIGDDMSNNTQLNHLIGSMRVTPETVYKTFVSVASQIFQDGTINWGRIVTLFYFAYKLAIQVLNQLPLIDIVIGWVTKFVTERLASWILARGGWKAVREYFGATSTQLAVVFIAGVALSSIFWLWKK